MTTSDVIGYIDLLESDVRSFEEALHRGTDLFAANDAISRWSPAQHAVHTAVATRMMLGAVGRIVTESAPAEPKGSPTIVGRAVLMSGRIPRGKGKAPRQTTPQDSPSQSDVDEAVAKWSKRVAALRDDADRIAAASWRAAHPYFGMLSAEQWFKVAHMHARHHLAIVEEITRA